MDDDELIRADRRRHTLSREKICGILMALGAAAVAFIFFNRPELEPEFQGVRLSVHLSRLVNQKSIGEYQSATNALAEAGTNALQVVLRIIQHPEPWYVRVYFRQQRNMPRWLEQQMRKQLDPWFYRNRMEGAIHAVALLGTNAAPIAKELVAELPSLENSSRTPLSEALVKIGPAVLEPLKPLLTSTNMRTRSLAAYICYMLNTRAADAAPELVAGLLDGDANHQRLVGQTLARMGSDARSVVLELLSSTNRIMITAGLQGMDGATLQRSQLVEKILLQLDHPDGDIRRNAALLIARTWPVNSAQVEERLRPWEQENERIADYLNSLQMIEIHRDHLIAVLQEGVRDPDIRTRLKFIGELIRHRLINDELIAALDVLSEENIKP